MGQYLELAFLADKEVPWERVLAIVTAHGLRKDADCTPDKFVWFHWDMEGLQLHTSVTEHSGGEGNWFVTVGFDNHKIGDAGMDARYRILHEMIALGRALWRSFDFLEGYLGREDEGPFVTLWESASRDQLWNQLPRASFAAFLGRAVSDRLSLTSWARGLRPPPRIEGFKPEGTLMIWDDSPRAAANFLETLG